MRDYYIKLYQKNFAFYERYPRAKRALLFSNLALTGIFALAYLALVIYALFLPMPVYDALTILYVPALGAVSVAFLRPLIDRPRPYSEFGAKITPILHKKSKDKESFPSRHVTCAVAISLCFLPHLLGAGICLLALSCVLAYVRFALGLHYPSDLFGGATLGCLCGLLLCL